MRTGFADENGDEHLSEDEFAQLGPDETRQKTKDEWKRERLQEFHQNIDLNGDGLASRQELLVSWACKCFGCLDVHMCCAVKI